jgi:hypothetical protein
MTTEAVTLDRNLLGILQHLISNVGDNEGEDEEEGEDVEKDADKQLMTNFMLI